LVPLTWLQRSCGVPANPLHGCNALAEFPQTPYTAATLLQSSRKPLTRLQRSCGVPASLLHGCNAFAEFPQASYTAATPLRKFRRPVSLKKRPFGKILQPIYSLKALNKHIK
ncbi:MAG: hypothetical protein LBU91_04625, partial [Bacteroidales bacterium]|nr:hypothetical protein [Bacteroidales bacterium]